MPSGCKAGLKEGQNGIVLVEILGGRVSKESFYIRVLDCFYGVHSVIKQEGRFGPVVAELRSGSQGEVWTGVEGHLLGGVLIKAAGLSRHYIRQPIAEDNQTP
jgi:hypothetical protein